MSTPLPIVAYIDPTGGTGLPPNVLWSMVVGTIGIFAGWLGLFTAHRKIKTFVKGHVALSTVLGIVLVLGIGMAIRWWWSDDSSDSTKPVTVSKARVLILGFDGMDPQLVDQFMRESRLPNLTRLSSTGIYHPLATSSPPQSPVAWSTFITGTDSAHHGVFDFIKRDPSRIPFGIDLATADLSFKKLPWVGTPFWEKPTIARLGFVGLRLPMAFPADRLNKFNGRILAGMGVPDVRLTEGTYFFYSTKPINNPDARGKLLLLTKDGAVLKGSIPGPFVAGGADDTLEPFELTPTADGATMKISGKTYTLTRDHWSDFISIVFRMGALGLQRTKAITRVLLKNTPEGETTLYISPPNFDPVSPAVAISNPKGFSAELHKAIGPYVTRGMPFDTQAVNDGLLGDADFLEQVHQINGESEAMLFKNGLPQFGSGVLFTYFEASDIVQHMFWRGIDPKSPLANDPETLKHKDAIAQIYEQLDGIAGRAMDEMGGNGAVVVISDHGFGPFRQSVHLNSVLRELGYLKLKPGKTSSDQFFADVDWSQTKAYALGFQSIYLNLKGREAEGIVDPQDAQALADNITHDLEAWKEPAEGDQPIKKVRPIGRDKGASWNDKLPDLIVGYKRGYRGSWETALGGVPAKTIEPNVKKWSGDHCIDESEVPGVFFSSDRNLDAKALADVGSAVEAYLAAKDKATPAAASK